MLKKLIFSIIENKIDRSFVKNVDIIIVDNDKEKTAEGIIEELKAKLNENYKLNYYNYSQKGLSNVRNELIKKTLTLKPDFLVFIDDDEYVSSEWLIELVRTIIRNKGDMTMGPVISIFETDVTDSLSCWFNRPDYLNDKKLSFIRTGNLIINMKSFVNYNIWFDNRFNKTGSEDSYFGQQMLKKGATIYWAANATAYETVSKNRVNIKWLIKRYYNGANTYTHILKLEKKYLALLKKTVVNLIYIILGMFALVLIPIPIKRKYWGLLKLSEGIGGVTALFNVKYYEYK